MCGIFLLLNDIRDEEKIISNFEKGKMRGPESSNITFFHDHKAGFGFHRLAINGLNNSANQPMTIDGYTLICNGEIYNYKELHEFFAIKNSTGSDCEIIIHLYKKFGIDQTLRLIDGVFAFALFDRSQNKIVIARDLFGVRPLFIAAAKSKVKKIAFASEIKMMANLWTDKKTITPFTPGTYSVYEFISSEDVWKNIIYEKSFAKITSYINYDIDTEEKAMTLLKNSLMDAVKKRFFTTNRPIACLLSGGLDSSLITALVKKLVEEEGYPTQLETYSIGLQGSEDLKYARKVADFLNTKHTEIICTESEFLDEIPNVIYNIESYDTTTVRASVGNYLVAKYIAEHSDAKVIFNGDGSDEVCGGYLYFHLAPDAIAFDKECHRLLKDIHLFDVLRSDRSISSNGLEARTPFLDTVFVNAYLSIPPNIRFVKGKPEKYLLRKAFEPMNLLPQTVLWRTKEAFSDGVSPQKKSWYEIIQSHINTLPPVTLSEASIIFNPPTTKEQKYYRYIFEKHYKTYSNVIPYFWMPKFTNATDSSARTLKIYKNGRKKSCVNCKGSGLVKKLYTPCKMCKKHNLKVCIKCENTKKIGNFIDCSKCFGAGEIN
jgi:asparagine synthase (glutamine-hydrolysing)